MPLSHRDNFIRNASLQGHEWIPIYLYPSGSLWLQHGREMEDVCLRYPILFPGFQRGSVNYEQYRRVQHERVEVDAWGVKWQSEIDGMVGLVIDSPLRDWSRWATWRAPPPRPFTDVERRRILDARARGDLTSVDTEHGFLLMRLYYLRGYEGFMMDVADDDFRLQQLVNVVADYWERVIKPYVDLGVDLVSAADDQGTQTASMLGPRHFRRWLMPTYQRLFLPQRAKGGHVFMHTDGYIMDILDELIESGVSIVNPQDLLNGIDNIARACKGRVCVRCDIDRQSVLPHGSPREVRELIKEEVMKLGSPRGGLEFVCGLYAPTPIENVEALFSALEEFRTYWTVR